MSSVSPEASTANQSAPFSITVRQQPEQAIEAPSATSSTANRVAIANRVSVVSVWRASAATRPTSVTIPVNMA